MAPFTGSLTVFNALILYNTEVAEAALLRSTWEFRWTTS